MGFYWSWLNMRSDVRIGIVGRQWFVSNGGTHGYGRSGHRHAVRKTIGLLSSRYVGRQEGSIPCAAPPKPHHSAFRAEFSSQYPRLQATWRGMDSVRKRRGIVERRTAPIGCRIARSVLRPTKARISTFFRKWGSSPTSASAIRSATSCRM